MLRQSWKKILIIGLLLLLGGVCCNLAFPRWMFLIPGQRERYQERLDEVLGEVELIVGAEHGIIAAKVSPDGRWLMAKRNPRHAKRTMLVDLEKREFYLFEMDSTAIQWLDNRHVYSTRQPKIIQVPDLVGWGLEFRSPDPDSLDVLANANHIFAIENGSSARLVTTDPDLPYVVSVGWDHEELEANLAGIPHTILTRPILCPTVNSLPPYLKDCIRRIYSPDGQYYFQQARHPDEQHQIKGAQPVIFESQTDERVAHMYKWNWWLRELGWAGDSSGAYFEVISEGEVWDRELEAHPIYKLLVPGATPGPPLKEVALPSPEESR